MRLSRTVTTLGIWFAGIFGVQQLLGRLTYQVGFEPLVITNSMPSVPDGTFQEITQTIMNPTYAQVSGGVQIMIFVLCFILIAGLISATKAIWSGTESEVSQDQQERTSRRQAEKIKREQRERMLRLMERMDEDDLAALEYQLADDGELVRKA